MPKTIADIRIRSVQSREKNRFEVMVTSVISELSILCAIKIEKKGNLFLSFFYLAPIVICVF
jgi:hypothetical protein